MRRIVTSTVNGRSTIVSDGKPPRTHEFENRPGFESSLIWATEDLGRRSVDSRDITLDIRSMIPAPGESRLIFIRQPPDVDAKTTEAFLQERREHSPGIAEAFEADKGGMHFTPSADYIIILSGEIWLVLDEGEVRLEAGDIVVQNRSRHAWSNRTSKAVELVAVLLGSAG